MGVSQASIPMSTVCSGFAMCSSCTKHFAAPDSTTWEQGWRGVHFQPE